MNKLQAIKTYFWLGADAYDVIKKWEDKELRKKVTDILSSDSFKNLEYSNKRAVYKNLSSAATREDALNRSILLDNVFKLILDKNLNHSYYLPNCLDLIWKNPAFDVTSAYDLEKKQGSCGI